MSLTSNRKLNKILEPMAIKSMYRNHIYNYIQKVKNIDDLIEDSYEKDFKKEPN